MDKNLVATAEIEINAPVEKVWDALVNPAIIKQYMFGSDVTSDWQEGSTLTWKGEWQGKPYEDTGIIKKIVPEETLVYTHSSSMDPGGKIHSITIELGGHGDHTHVMLSQDNNATEEAQKHSVDMWTSVLQTMKKVVEG